MLSLVVVKLCMQEEMSVASVKSGISHYLPSLMRRSASTSRPQASVLPDIAPVLAKKKSKWVTGAKWTGFSVLGLGLAWRALVHNARYFSEVARYHNNFEKTRQVISNTIFDPIRDAITLPLWLAEKVFHAPVHGCEAIHKRVNRDVRQRRSSVRSSSSYSEAEGEYSGGVTSFGKPAPYSRGSGEYSSSPSSPFAGQDEGADPLLAGYRRGRHRLPVRTGSASVGENRYSGMPASPLGEDPYSGRAASPRGEYGRPSHVYNTPIRSASYDRADRETDLADGED